MRERRYDALLQGGTVLIRLLVFRARGTALEERS
jgi:hypothetical protein